MQRLPRPWTRRCVGSFLHTQQGFQTVSEIFTLEKQGRIGDDRPALVLDTNTVLALWMFRDPTLNAIREWIEAGNCRLYSRGDALEELRRVLAYRQFGVNEFTQQAINQTYRSFLTGWSPPADATPVEELTPLARCRDTDDQKFLEIASQAQATHLVTRDKALLKLARHRSIRGRFAILTPERLLAAMLSGRAVDH